jgi:hypothetical protein
MRELFVDEQLFHSTLVERNRPYHMEWQGEIEGVLTGIHRMIVEAADQLVVDISNAITTRMHCAFSTSEALFFPCCLKVPNTDLASQQQGMSVN